MKQLELLKADLTTLKVDAIVNAANQSLLGGGGVDGAIHRVAGSKLLQACIPLKGCPTGKAKITPGFQLPASWVIHTVGPVWHTGKQNEHGLLASCYTESLQLGALHQLKSIAFPNISTGVYHFPKTEAAEIAIEAVVSFLAHSPFPEKVIFCCFDDKNYSIYKTKLQAVKSTQHSLIKVIIH